MKQVAAYIPFFYFLKTRLNNFKALVFHTVYEWLPTILIISFYGHLAVDSILIVSLSYVAFISVYELGYLINDQLAHFKPHERARDNPFSLTQILIFFLLRILIFLTISWYLNQQNNSVWWFWYAALVLIFTFHNTLKNMMLKCVTFSSLAFIRFFSAFFILLDSQLILIMALPVFLNYVLFRLVTYMDSKNILKGVDRKSDFFRIGYYILLVPISGVLFILTGHEFPLWINIYFIIMNLSFVLIKIIGGKSLASE